MSNSRGIFPRQLAARLRHDLTVYPAVALMGARQVGKTTLAREVGRELGLAYRSLDDRDVRLRAVEDPEGLIESVSESGAIFDEVQRVPDLLLSIKAVVDREQKPGRFILTGSNQPRVAGYVADSLVGRAAYRTLRPLTLSEQRYDASSRRWSWFFETSGRELERRLIESATLGKGPTWSAVTAAGGMPRALAAAAADRFQVLEDYLQTFAQRDVREVLEVESSSRLEQFLKLAATRTGTELNFSNLGRDV